MKYTKPIAFIIAILFFEIWLVIKVEERSFYDGMANYCLYVPYYYVDTAPRYRTQEGCQEIVDDARAKGLYYNPRQLTGPGIDFGPAMLPFEDN